MLKKLELVLLQFILLVALVLLCSAASKENATQASGPEYTSDGQLKLPANYRDWVYLTTGFDMSYSPAMQMQMDDHSFDNVFVNPEAYKEFLASGTWPDKTMLLIESRGARTKGSINQSGNFQGEVQAREIHVKDEARFPGKWAFFAFGDQKTAKMIPAKADCYSCHAEHAAVDTTFVQFYPTLLPIAKAKGTLSPSYQKEAGVSEAPKGSTYSGPSGKQ